MSEKKSLQDIYKDSSVNLLLSKQNFSYTELNENVVASSFIPNLGWYVVAEESSASALAQRDEAIRLSASINQMDSTISEIASSANVAAEAINHPILV